MLSSSINGTKLQSAKFTSHIKDLRDDRTLTGIKVVLKCLNDKNEDKTN